jgi:hypothetical protein
MVNGKRYIGQKKFDNASRWKSYLGSGYHLTRAINKYGKDNFVRNIVDIGFSEGELNLKEEQWINNYKAVESDDFYNMVDGGKVQDSLKRRNSIKVICIDNNMIFNSIADASVWSGYTAIKIKKTFKMKHTYENYKNENYIFRLLPEKKIDKRVCCICGKFLTNDRHWCKTCSKCAVELEKTNKLKKCLDCGSSFTTNSNRQVRCHPCQTKRNKENNRIKSKTYRKKNNLINNKNSAFHNV